MQTIKVMLVDDHKVVREGLKLIIESNELFEVVSLATTHQDAVQAYRASQPDVVLMDVQLEQSNGIEACKEILTKDPCAKIIILTSFSDEDLVTEAILAGAKGYLGKYAGHEDLFKAIEAVYRGESLLDPAITVRVFERMKKLVRREYEEELLNPQEKRILSLIAEGKTNKDIAEELNLSPKTVKNYVSNILSKLNLSNRAEAAVYAVKNNFVLK